MSDQPDKLFREKLYGHQRSVPSQTWSQVSANLNNKRRLVWWRSAAAAIALLCVAGIVIYPLTRTNPAEITNPTGHSVAEVESPPTSPIPGTQLDIDNEEPKPATASLTTPDEGASFNKHASEKKSQSPQPPLANSDTINEELPVIPDPEPQPLTRITQTAQTPGTKTTDQVTHSDPKQITIVFTQAEVNAKYLLKTQRSDATSGDQGTSRLKNMLDKAYDLTHNQDLIGDLRQKKNEILAMNFKKGKTDTQND